MRVYDQMESKINLVRSETEQYGLDGLAAAIPALVSPKTSELN